MHSVHIMRNFELHCIIIEANATWFDKGLKLKLKMEK